MQTPVDAQAEVQITAPSRRKSLPTLSALLFRLVLACLLPALLGVGIMIYMDYERGRMQTEASTRLSVQDKLEAVDAQLAQAELFAQTLATNASLIQQDFATFHQKSLGLLRANNLNFTVFVYDANGQQLINTDIPYGERLLKRRDIANIKSVFVSGQMMPSHIALRTSDGQPTVGILVPVFSGEQVVYALSVGFSPVNFNRFVEQKSVQADGIAAIVDSTGTIVAISSDTGNFFGPQVAPELLKQLKTQSEATFDLKTVAGMPVRATYRRSPSSGWTVAISIPKKSIETPLIRNFFALTLGGILLLGLSLGSAWVVGKRIAKSVRHLHDAAVALGAGDLTDMPATATSETHELSQALQASARSLKRRTQQLQTANETLQERSNELSEAQLIAKIGNWRWNANTGALFASDELLRLYGRKILSPFDAQKGKVFPAEAWQELKMAVKATLQNKTGFSLQLPTLTEGKTQLWARINGELVFSATGEVTGLRGTLQNVDADVKADMALKDSESRLSLALSNSDLSLWDWNIKTGDLFFDDRWATLQGDSLEKIPTSKESFMRNVYSEDIPAIQAAVELYFQGETSKYEASYRVFHKDGHCIWIHASGKIVERDADGMPVRMLGVAWDTTERKQHEVEITRLQTELQDILAWQVAQHTVAALAHEVNQPLASASILSEAANRMLRTNELSDDAKVENLKRLKQTLKCITSDIERAGDVLRNLLKSVNKPDITQAPTKVNGLVAESIKTAAREGVFGYRIMTDCATDLPLAKVNHLQVVKVVLNLIHNAAQSMHGATVANGKIWISTALTADGSEICVSVRDEGPGISASLQEEIFQPFITTKPHGLGMGLTISRALIEANGGKLWHSQDNGLGATFHFTLPVSS
jgi:PAS domain S-box-containing protein